MAAGTCPAQNGNTLISAPGAPAHGLSLAGNSYSFIAHSQLGKMIIVTDTMFGEAMTTKVEFMSVADARARYAALTAKGAAKRTAKRTAYGYNYSGSQAFDTESILMVPETDLQVRWERSGKVVSAGVSIG